MGKLFFSRDVTFNENVFPYKTQQIQILPVNYPEKYDYSSSDSNSESSSDIEDTYKDIAIETQQNDSTNTCENSYKNTNDNPSINETIPLRRSKSVPKPTTKWWEDIMKL